MDVEAATINVGEASKKIADKLPTRKRRHRRSGVGNKRLSRHSLHTDNDHNSNDMKLYTFPP